MGEDNRQSEFANLTLAEKYNKRIIRLEYGFISSRDIALKESPQLSLILCPEVMYFDATRISDMEKHLNDAGFNLSVNELNRANENIKNIVSKGITKYNHAPKFELSDKVFLNNSKKKILLVDQRYGDMSIKMGLASQDSFEDMLNKALEYDDHDIYIKLHPDALTGGKESSLSKVLPPQLPDNVYLIDFDINPYYLLKEMDKVFVCVSQFGFEALMAGKEVHTFGVSFYSHWGITNDYIEFKRRNKKRTMEELFHVFYIMYSSYYVPELGRVPIEGVIKYFSEPEQQLIEKEVKSSAIVSSKPLKILFVLPSGRFGASGRYIQELAWYMRKYGSEVMVLAEGNEIKNYSGITWLNLKFAGSTLDQDIIDRVVKFSPDFVFENGVRSRAQRAALEIISITGAKLALQSEDDDIQVYNERHPNPSPVCINSLDKKDLNSSDFSAFIKNNDWQYTLRVLQDPNFDRWVEPFMRAICYQLSVFNTAIWYPFEERLKRDFGKPTFVLPPVTDGDKLENMKLSTSKLKKVLSKYNFTEEGITFFLGGTIYDYSEEYFIFLDALNLLSKLTNQKVQFITVSGRSNINVEEVTKNILNTDIQYYDMGSPNDDEYLDMLMACDVVCSPGVPDRFNLYRLPSRLVKAMFLSKAVLTSKCGFGESLKHGYNGIIIDGKEPYNWAVSINEYIDKKSIHSIGHNGLSFAKEHFDVKKAARELIKQFQLLG